MYQGDFDTTETVNLPFNTFSSNDPSASVTITNLAAGDIEIHKDGGVTQRTSDVGVTVSIDFDGITGNHMIHIDLSDNTHAGFYSDGSRYQVRIEGATVDAGTINAWIGTFSIGILLRPTTAGRTLDVNATGEAGLDLDNTSGTLAAAQFASNFLTAAKIATDAFTAAKFGADFLTSAKIANDAFLAVNFAASSLDGKGDWNTVVPPTEAQMNARTILSANYVVVGDTLARVTLVDTTTTNTDLVTAAVIADAVADELVTAAEHNVPNSLARRIREIASDIVLTGTSPDTAGTANTEIRIELDGDASVTDGAYDPAIIVITAGTGVGQARQIWEYDGTNKYAYINRTWKMIPDNTSEYTIVGNSGNTHVNEGICTGGANTSITLNALASSVDDTYKGQIVFLAAGTGEDQARMITAYNGTSKVATVATWETNPVNGATMYAILPVNTLLASEVNAECDTAISDAGLPEGIPKNAIFNNFEFLMVDETDGFTPETGLTVTGQRSIDGAAFAGVSGAIAEIGSGIYQFDAAAADTNGDLITWKFASAGAADRFFTFKTTS